MAGGGGRRVGAAGWGVTGFPCSDGGGGGLGGVQCRGEVVDGGEVGGEGIGIVGGLDDGGADAGG